MKYTYLFLLAAAVVQIQGCSQPCGAKSINWIEEFDQVRTEAAKSGKNILFYVSALSTGDPRANEAHTKALLPGTAALLGCDYIPMLVDIRKFGDEIEFGGRKIKMADFFIKQMLMEFEVDVDDKGKITRADPPAAFLFMDATMSRKLGDPFYIWLPQETSEKYLNRLKKLRYN